MTPFFGIFSIYCVWLWIWTYLYFNDIVKISPLISSMIAFTFTLITMLTYTKFTIPLRTLLVLGEAFVFYINYKKHTIINKTITINSLNISFNLLLFLIYNFYLYLNKTDFYKVYNIRVFNRKLTLKQWFKNRMNDLYLFN